MMIIYFAQNVGKVLVILTIYLWLWAKSYDKINSVPIWLQGNDKIHSEHKEITC